MFDRLCTACLIAVGIINFLPVVGVLSPAVLTRLYEVPVTDPDIVLLLRHRAVLFGLLGGLILASVLRKEWRGLAIVLGGISLVAFVVLAMLHPTENEAIAKVVRADVLALVLLVFPVIQWGRKASSDRNST